MKTLVFSALFALFLSGCAGAGLAVLAPAVDGGVANERGQTSYVAKGIHWACDQIGGTYATDGSGDCNGPL